MYECYEGMEDDSGKEYTFKDPDTISDVDTARKIAKEEVKAIYNYGDVQFLLDELDAYIDRPECYIGDEREIEKGYPTKAEVNKYIKHYIRAQGEADLFDMLVAAINDGYFYDYDGEELDEDAIEEMNQLLR